VAENLRVMTGAAEYESPELQWIIEVQSSHGLFGQIALGHRAPD
jgi:hypothetical protein